MNALDLAAALGNPRPMPAGAIFGQCPAHDDSNPSLHITDSNDGKILVKCMAGCDQTDVISALKSKGLWNSNGAVTTQPKLLKKYDAPPPWERPIEAEYDYMDESGNLQYTNVKFSDGLNPRFMAKNADDKWGREGIQSILFSLPELMVAKRGICIVEGEKDVLNLEKLKFTATTSGGANSWKREYNQYFKGKDVCIIPDNDVAGRKYSAQVSILLDGIAKTIKIITLPDMKKGGDVSDWLANGGTRKSLIDIIKNTEEGAAQAPQPGVTPGEEPEESVDSRLEEIGIIPYKDTTSAGIPLPTKENFYALMKSHNITCKYDVISKEVSIRIPNEEATIIDTKAQSQLTDIRSICGRHRFPLKSVGEMLARFSIRDTYNPVADWIVSKPWDGQDRYKDLVETLDSKNKFSTEKLLWRWMLSAVAACFEPEGVAARGVLVLQGKQHLGKTYWLRALVAGHEEWFLEGETIRPSDKDSVMACVSNWIVEAGEFDATFKKADISALKSFFGKKIDTLYLRYSEKVSTFPRRTVFAGSVNPKIYLNDPTGNTRFWTVECGSGLDSYHKIDMQQVWAQIKSAYDSGEGWALTKDELGLLSGSNEEFEFSSPILEMILKKYDTKSTVTEEKQAAEVCLDIGYPSPSNIQARECGEALRKTFGDPKRVGGKIVWDVPMLRKWGD